MVGLGEKKADSEQLTLHRSRIVITAVFAIIATLYVTPLFVADPSLLWAAGDEICCHVPAIKAIQEEGLLATVQDAKNYRSATTPLYHMLMSVVLGRVDPVVLRMTWVIATLAVGFLLYRHVRTDGALRRGGPAAAALAIAFLLSPTIRASAVYFVTDGLALLLAIVALVLLRRAQAGPGFSAPWGAFSIIVAYLSFYTRQYYLWAMMYVAYIGFTAAATIRAKIGTTTGCLLLTVPAIGLFGLWHGLTPPWERPFTHPKLLSTVPNALGLLAVYSLPLGWIAAREGTSALRQKMGEKAVGLPLFVVCCIGLYVAAGLALGVEIPREGILRVVDVFGSSGAVVYLAFSSLGLVMLLRWLAVDGVRQLWWAAFLLPLLAGSMLHQRYFEPAILLFMFLVARPGDALKVLDSRLVWYYPLFTAVYALSRTIYFASNL
jgi:hypothetical protein